MGTSVCRQQWSDRLFHIDLVATAGNDDQVCNRLGLFPLLPEFPDAIRVFGVLDSDGTDMGAVPDQKIDWVSRTGMMNPREFIAAALQHLGDKPLCELACDFIAAGMWHGEP
ncbi:hypothetical protein RC52_14660 [Herbaspirillum rubrisubalbicans]|uniref:Uncharacterized protein n=1 Tax=Herbaspirillum rubrisubalbicans Os34 TaxID=1235827 RepID=A0A6M3ZZA3_9BURK|nr:hypothetical protein [Herbaspirillum rubrisubalbicans]QJQ03533.1 hypothetical protein C798_25835 [Herbaspirillum rubrisubalbicans Os34]